jgi:hypothetical protein
MRRAEQWWRSYPWFSELNLIPSQPDRATSTDLYFTNRKATLHLIRDKVVPDTILNNLAIIFTMQNTMDQAQHDAKVGSMSLKHSFSFYI